MSRFEAANLIRLFDFYLAAMFLLSFARRYRVYFNTIRLLVVLRGRWPRLTDRLAEHHAVLFKGEVLKPLLLAIGLTAIQMIASRLIWPQAELTVRELLESWTVILFIVALLPMFAVDVYFLVRVGQFDRGETEKYLDQAEHWLGTWKAPAIRMATLGYVDPHRMVDREVKKSLEQIGETVSWASWWVSAQVGCRVAFGLVVWSLWALS